MIIIIFGLKLQMVSFGTNQLERSTDMWRGTYTSPKRAVKRL